MRWRHGGRPGVRSVRGSWLGGTRRRCGLRRCRSCPVCGPGMQMSVLRWPVSCGQLTRRTRPRWRQAWHGWMPGCLTRWAGHGLRTSVTWHGWWLVSAATVRRRWVSWGQHCCLVGRPVRRPCGHGTRRRCGACVRQLSLRGGAQMRCECEAMVCGHGRTPSGRACVRVRQAMRRSCVRPVRRWAVWGLQLRSVRRAVEVCWRRTLWRWGASRRMWTVDWPMRRRMCGVGWGGSVRSVPVRWAMHVWRPCVVWHWTATGTPTRWLCVPSRASTTRTWRRWGGGQVTRRPVRCRQCRALVVRWCLRQQAMCGGLRSGVTRVCSLRAPRMMALCVRRCRICGCRMQPAVARQGRCRGAQHTRRHCLRQVVVRAAGVAAAAAAAAVVAVAVCWMLWCCRRAVACRGMAGVGRAWCHLAPPTMLQCLRRRRPWHLPRPTWRGAMPVLCRLCLRRQVTSRP